MMVNMHEAKTKLSKLVELVEAGEEVVIGRAGRPVARLVPYAEARPERLPGALKGQVRIAADFDETPGWLVDAFEGDA